MYGTCSDKLDCWSSVGYVHSSLLRTSSAGFVEPRFKGPESNVLNITALQRKYVRTCKGVIHLPHANVTRYDLPSARSRSMGAVLKTKKAIPRVFRLVALLHGLALWNLLCHAASLEAMLFSQDPSLVVAHHN